MERYDILGLGSVAIDEVLYVDHFPEMDTKTRVRHRLRQCGGLTATALIAAARLGCRCAYGGVLGSNPISLEVVEAFQAEGVSIEPTLRTNEGGPIQTTIIVDESRHTRTIFFDLTGSVGAVENHPSEAVIQSSRILFVDHYGIEGMTRAARIARDATIPVVADLERNEWPGFDNLLSLVDHLIISRAFAKKLTGLNEPGAAIEALWTSERQVTVITDGEHGCWYRTVESPRSVSHFPAYPVTVADTTGCGDVFHGTWCWGLLEGLPVAERIRFASAAAALKATRRGGQPAIADLPEIRKFLECHETDGYNNTAGD